MSSTDTLTADSAAIATTPCAAPGSALERTRYVNRMLVGATDLTQDQVYFREKLRRHNRLLHGWGIVCGASVRQGEEPMELIVGPGYILAPPGDDILIDCEVTLDVSKEDLSGLLGAACTDVPVDPWCSEVPADWKDGQTLYLAVRYQECPKRPVRILPEGCACGCDETACEYSRIRDGYAFKVLTELPSGYSDPMPHPALAASFSCMESNQLTRCCPGCPPDPCVILADFTISNGKIATLDLEPHRRYVASFANFYYLCAKQNGQTPTTNVPVPA
jgi:hypothetical protein